jgi:hypothetical protein
MNGQKYHMLGQAWFTASVRFGSLAIVHPKIS